MMATRQVREVIEMWSGSDFYGNIEDMIERLLAVRRLHPSVVVKLDYDYTYDYGSTDRYFAMTAYYERDETAAEIAKREAQADEYREKRRKQFEAMKKEFGED